MAALLIKNHHRRPISVFDKQGNLRKILAGGQATVDVPVPNVRRLLRWGRSGGLQVTELPPGTVPVTPPVTPVTPTPAAGGTLDFSDPANSGHIPGI